MNNNQNSGGVGFVGLLTIVFVTLKLTGTIDWSWWWVLAPVWLSAAVALICLAVAVAISVKIERRRASRSRAFRAGTYRPDGWWK